ncbi:MAG: NADH oxidase [Caulobacterales bacterium]
MLDTHLTMLALVKESGELEIALSLAPIPEPRDHEVVVQVLAAPINPSDIGAMIGAADVSRMRGETRDGLPVLIADISPAGMRAMAGRVGRAMKIGNEGCGKVVKAGASAEAQALLGKTVAILNAGMYAQYHCLAAAKCMVLPDEVDPADGAACFVNPLTALGFLEVMRREGHTALAHTAAASNLGRMLVKICAKDGVPLVNIVRSEAHVGLLQGIGAKYVVNSSAEMFTNDLVRAFEETGATLCFDAIGGGNIASRVFGAMEAAAVKRGASMNGYGSDTFKQVYVYGGLDPSPTTLTRNFGFTWSLSAFLLTPYLNKFGPEVVDAMRKRIVSEIGTTFKSEYSHEISLSEALDPAVFHEYNAKRTGDKYLIRPQA